MAKSKTKNKRVGKGVGELRYYRSFISDSRVVSKLKYLLQLTLTLTWVFKNKNSGGIQRSRKKKIIINGGYPLMSDLRVVLKFECLL